MKRIILAAIIVFLSSSQLSQAGYYQSLSSRISNIGVSIEKVENVPVIGKLTNILPIAAIAACLKTCPMQTMILLSALTTYLLSQNETVQEMLQKYELIPSSTNNNKKSYNDESYIDEDLFIFDKDDEDDDQVVQNNVCNTDASDKIEENTQQAQCKRVHSFV